MTSWSSARRRVTSARVPPVPIRTSGVSGASGAVLPCDSTFTQPEATPRDDYPPRFVPARVVDIAGVPVTLDAADPERAAILTALVAGFAETTEPGVATLTADAAVAEPPSGDAHSEMFGIRFWQAGSGCVIAARSMVIDIGDTVAHAHLADIADAALLEGCGYLPISWLLATHRRFMVHGAAVERDGVALLLLGNSGAGKSTLTAAALDAGWRALSDDLTIVEAGPPFRHEAGPPLRIHGVHKAPAIPAEIGGKLVESADVLGDPRDRVGVSRDVLTMGGHSVTGVVMIVHADSPSGSLRSLAGHEVLPLLLQSFAGSIEPARRSAFFPTATRLCRLPLWELGHATDPASRRDQAARHLDVIARALTENG